MVRRECPSFGLSSVKGVISEVTVYTRMLYVHNWERAGVVRIRFIVNMG